MSLMITKMDYNYLRLEQQIRALMNITHASSSGSSKTTEELKNGNNTFLVDAIKHHFLFKYGGVAEPLSVDPITKSILNVQFINDVDVTKLVGGLTAGYGISIQNMGNGIFKLDVVENMFVLKNELKDELKDYRLKDDLIYGDVE